MDVTRTTFIVDGMTCEHCVAAVSAEVSRIPNVTDVAVDLTAGTVVVGSHGPVDPAAVTEAVDEAGYEVRT